MLGRDDSTSFLCTHLFQNDIPQKTNERRNRAPFSILVIWELLVVFFKSVAPLPGDLLFWHFLDLKLPAKWSVTSSKSVKHRLFFVAGNQGKQNQHNRRRLIFGGSMSVFKVRLSQSQSAPCGYAIMPGTIIRLQPHLFHGEIQVVSTQFQW